MYDNKFDNIDETTGMRIVEHDMNRRQKARVNVFDYVIFAFLLIIFLFLVLGILAFLFRAISDYSNGNEYGAGWHMAWCVMSLPMILIFGLPVFFTGKNIVKYHKVKKKYTKIMKEDNCVPAIVSKIDYIDHAYAKDEYWLVCDVINEANHTIYRYKSEKVKEDLFLKFKEGDRIAVYIHPEDPEDYYVDLSAIVSDSDLSDLNINKVYKVENNEKDNKKTMKLITKERKSNNYEETDDATGMRTVERGMKIKSKFVSVFEYVVLVLCVLFLLLFGYCLIGGISMVIKYWDGIGGGFGVMGIIMSIPMILLFGWPVISISRDKIKRRKIKNHSKLVDTGNRILATVKMVDFIDYKYAKDVFWVVCDYVNEEENIINRYISHRVKEDLFAKIEPGQQIAVYINPDNPDNYYVNLDEIQ